MKRGSSFTRRQFIATVAAATAATALPTGAFALGQAGTAATPHASALDPDWAPRHYRYPAFSLCKIKAGACARGDYCPRLLVEAAADECRLEHSQHAWN
jgi:hypothetical protein